VSLAHTFPGTRGLLAAGAALGLLACGSGASDGARTGEASAPASAPGEPTAAPSQARGRAAVAPVTSSGDEAYDSAALGALHGTVLFAGEAPERFPYGAGDRPECKHHAEVDQRANIVVVNDGKLAGAFVHLKSGYDGASIPPAPNTAAQLDQRGCMYVPRVLALQLGQKLLVANSDPTNHNVHVRAQRNRASNQNVGAGQSALEFTFERAEAVPFACDIHPWMGAVVHVAEHPWFAVSDEHGAFHIRDVPPGEYVVEAEHEKLGSVSGSVKVTAGSSTGFTLTLRAKK
jgi:plastocyanin